MTPLLFVLAAAVGAIARYGVGKVACSWQALLVVNTTGAALLGFVASRDVSDATLTIVGVGLCGALTTFSSFALETRSLTQRLGWSYGLAYVAATLVAATGAASIATTL